MEYTVVRKIVEQEIEIAELQAAVRELQIKIFPGRFKEKEK